MNKDSIERNSLHDYQSVLKSLGPWPAMMNSTWNSTGWDWTNDMARLIEKNPLLAIEVMVNPRDTKEYTFQVSSNFLKSSVISLETSVCTLGKY
jgi:hypothetical protein